MEPPGWLTYVSLGLGCWGALVSTVLALRTVVLDRPRIRINDVWTDVRKVSDTPMSHSFTVMVELENIGYKDAGISALGFVDEAHSRTVWQSEALRHAQPSIELPMTIKAKGTALIPVYMSVDDKPNAGWRYGVKTGKQQHLARHSGRERILG